VLFHRIFHGCVENFFGFTPLQEEEPPTQGRLFGKSSIAKLASHFFQQLLINIEIGVHVLHVVLILKRFHKPDHGVGGLTF
jgi:hypothetical protein